MKEVKTNSGKTYSVHTANGCTVSDDSGWSKTIDAPDGYFTAHGSTVFLSDDEATLREVFNAAPIGGSGAGGGSALSATGEKFGKMMHSASSAGTLTADLRVQHATWFDNTQNADTVRVLPAAWQNEVMTCYLKSAVPVGLSGVTWIYGEPTMAAGYTFVIALQQIDATAVLANLAYVLPQ